jgi:hypothetical protein
MLPRSISAATEPPRKASTALGGFRKNPAPLRPRMKEEDEYRTR